MSGLWCGLKWNLKVWIFLLRKIHWKTILKPVSDNPKDQNPKDLALEVLFLFRLIAYEEFLHLDDYRIVLCWEIMRTLFPCISIALFRYLYFKKRFVPSLWPTPAVAVLAEPFPTKISWEMSSDIQFPLKRHIS
ncbi:hypothetical protein P8452_39499 [Trifolium repens]|nr:hypothetical protein P8452_39499 [Trifolium repens]